MTRSAARVFNARVAAARLRVEGFQAELEDAYTAATNRAVRRSARRLSARAVTAASTPPPSDPGWSLPDPDELYDRIVEQAELYAETGPVRIRVLEDVVNGITRAFNLSFDVRNPLVEGVLRQLGQHITNVSETTRDQIMTALNEAWTDGLSIPDAARLIRKRAAMSQARAETIARTELLAAVNGGSLASARLTGVVSHKEWVATMHGRNASRTRPTHRAAHGQERPVASPFHVGGFDLDWPGDPSGPAQEVINCRCTLTYRTVKAERGAEPPAGPTVHHLATFPPGPGTNALGFHDQDYQHQGGEAYRLELADGHHVQLFVEQGMVERRVRRKPDGFLTDDTLASQAIAERYAQLLDDQPPGVRNNLKTLVVARGRNPGDAGFARRFGRADFSSAATANRDRGQVVAWNGDQYVMTNNTLWHELGHIAGAASDPLDQGVVYDAIDEAGVDVDIPPGWNRPNYGGPPSAEEWAIAAAHDTQHLRNEGLSGATWSYRAEDVGTSLRVGPIAITEYAEEGLAEDWAESVAFQRADAAAGFLVKRGYGADEATYTFADLFPARAAILARHLGHR